MGVGSRLVVDWKNTRVNRTDKDDVKPLQAVADPSPSGLIVAWWLILSTKLWLGEPADGALNVVE
jgi:hypothetical protein